MATIILFSAVRARIRPRRCCLRVTFLFFRSARPNHNRLNDGRFATKNFAKIWSGRRLFRPNETGHRESRSCSLNSTLVASSSIIMTNTVGDPAIAEFHSLRPAQAPQGRSHRRRINPRVKALQWCSPVCPSANQEAATSAARPVPQPRRSRSNDKTDWAAPAAPPPR
jgi:hypothetical protein